MFLVSCSAHPFAAWLPAQSHCQSHFHLLALVAIAIANVAFAFPTFCRRTDVNVNQIRLALAGVSRRRLFVPKFTHRLFFKGWIPFTHTPLGLTPLLSANSRFAFVNVFLIRFVRRSRGSAICFDVPGESRVSDAEWRVGEFKGRKEERDNATE